MRPPPSVLSIKPSVPSDLAGFEVRATASPLGYTGNSPSRTQTWHQSRCVGPAALGSAPPGWPTAGQGPSAGRPARGEPAGTAHTWRHGWRGLKGRSNGPRKRWQTCPYGCALVDADAPLLSQWQPGPGPAAGLEGMEGEICYTVWRNSNVITLIQKPLTNRYETELRIKY